MKGDKKMGKMHIFSTIGKKYAYFFPNCLRIYKIAKKENAARTPSLQYISLGEKISIQKGGGAKYEFQI